MRKKDVARATGAAVLTGLLACLVAAAPFEAQSAAPPSQKVLGTVKAQVQQKPAAGASQPAAAPAEAPKVVKRRDPFRSLLVRPDEMPGGQALPPGKAGLIISQVTVNGVVATPSELIAVVTMSGRNRSFFLREGDELYNGYVSKISEDGVVFKEKTVDAFGKEYEREVVKQLTAGTGTSGRGGARSTRPSAPRPSGGARPGPGA